MDPENDPTSLSCSTEDPTVAVKANKSGEGEGYSGSEDSDSNPNGKSAGVKIPKERRPYYESTEKYRKTLRLSSEQIVSFISQLSNSRGSILFSFMKVVINFTFVD